MLNEKTSTIEDYKKILTAAQDAARLHRSEVFNTRKAEFLAADGCQTCWGSHSVIVWGTLDCIRGSYDEFGVCPDCKEQQLWCGSNSNRKSGHPHVHNLPELFQTEEEKSTDDFYRQKRGKDGLMSLCKACDNKRALVRQRVWREENKDAVNKAAREVPESVKEKRRVYAAKWRKENKAKISGYDKKWAESKL